MKDRVRTLPIYANGGHWKENSETLNAIAAYLKVRPQATFEEVYEKFFKDHPCPMSGKAISSRHFEPIGTKTYLVMVEGRYMTFW